MKKTAVGVLAHVDSGKTTLTEAMLFAAGNIKKRGRVDHGDSFLDTYALERSRGITIFSKLALLEYGGARFTLLDTPGHVDFSAETERTLQVLDYAILVISCTDGVQSHTRTLWQLLEKYRVPCFLFINKTDLPGADPAAALRDVQEKLSDACVDFTDPAAPAFYEAAAVCDDALLEEYAGTGTLRHSSLCRAIAARRLFPCLFGSALTMEGVPAFLDALAAYTLPSPDAGAFGARVFKVAADARGERLTFLKITGGTLRVKETLASPKNRDGEKVQQIRLYSGDRFTTVETADAGTVCAVTGIGFLSPGDGLGAEKEGAPPVLSPVLSYSVLLPPTVDAHTALQKLRTLEAEDPQLHVEWDAEAKEIRLRLMGDVQLEVLAALSEERFGFPISFGKGAILYKETIAAPVEGVGHFEPLRHYAEVHLLLTPGKRNSGLVFRSACSEDRLEKNWQRLILTHLYEKTHRGVLTGAPITDMEITLMSGRAHPKHTEGGDFRQATYRAVRQGLRSAESILLEPIYDFTLEVPAEHVGRALTDIGQKNGSFSPPETAGDMAVITGSAPVAAMADYAAEVRRYTRGRGKLTCVFQGYAPCANAPAVIAAAGYDPDADTDNPCDSVFCAHGAGYNVKWDEVKSRMHLPSVLARTPAPAPAEAAPAGRAGARRPASNDIFAADKELIRIFERTYGPIRARRDPFDLHARPKGPAAKKEKPVKLPDKFAGKHYLLIDGYNVIFSWDRLRTLAEANMNDARDALIALLCNYQGYKQCELILVFDAYKVKGEREVERHGGISVVYTREAETADTYIEKASYELAKENRVRVVSSDNMEQIIIAGNGALRVSSEAFYEEIERTQKEIRALLENRAP